MEEELPKRVPEKTLNVMIAANSIGSKFSGTFLALSEYICSTMVTSSNGQSVNRQIPRSNRVEFIPQKSLLEHEEVFFWLKLCV